METKNGPTLDGHELRKPQNTTENSRIGAGKKAGLYGCAFFILAAVALIIILVFTGIYVPFEGTEGVGP